MEQGAAVAVGGIGFTVGKEANYHFRLGAAAVAADASAGYTEHVYDALGRLAAVAVYGNGKLLGDGVFEPDTLESLRLYVYDGWRLVSELDGLNGNRVVAEYVPGPTYVDDVVAARRDQNRDGDFNDAYEGFLYYLTDQQHSTVALLDGTGTVAERYGYDAFGAPSFHNGSGSPIAASAVGNDRLYTGRQWLPALKLYDYRQRLYDPAMGRFLTRDPVYDPANLGNPYTYVGNNPGAFVDPYGKERWGTQSYFADAADVGYGYFLSGVVDTATAAWELRHYSVGGYLGDLASGAGIAASGVAGAVGSLVSHPISATGRGLSGFYAQFEDSDTTGQATFAVASLAAAPIASTGVAAPVANTITKAGAFVTGTGTAAGAAQSALRARLIANLEASANATSKSQFDLHIATEKIYANASKAVKVAKEAGLTNKNGELGMRAHREFAQLNAATREKLRGRGIWIEIEPYALPSRRVAPGTSESLSVDALLQYRGVNIRGFDLKTGRFWSRAGVLERETRFKVPMQQIQR